MKLGDLSHEEYARRVSGSGLKLRTGPFTVRVQSDIAAVHSGLRLLYEHNPLAADADFADFHIALRRGRLLRRWLRPQARFDVDGVEPFLPLPLAQALPMLEWGMNWCITAYGHHQLVLHAAAVARGDRALVLPAPPGSGKSTLCAALVNRGWRLLSDELALVDLASGAISGLARPVNLKNESIGIIRRFAPEAVLSAACADTAKGTVALMKAPSSSVEQVTTPTRPAWIVLPRYTPGAAPRLETMPSGAAFLALADNAMNYHILGRQGFEAIGRLIGACSRHRFEYDALDDAVATLDALAGAA